jgi:hypothetical protein
MGAGAGSSRASSLILSMKKKGRISSIKRNKKMMKIEKKIKGENIAFFELSSREVAFVSDFISRKDDLVPRRCSFVCFFFPKPITRRPAVLYDILLRIIGSKDDATCWHGRSRWIDGDLLYQQLGTRSAPGKKEETNGPWVLLVYHEKHASNTPYAMI